jgi:tetratricopeptide (TPR) repeat protein
MTATVTSNEEAQLLQTIEMFEVITQSQPNDFQSLEILKEAYAKLGREQEVVTASKRIAQAYVQLGQLSSAILEYESVLQRIPGDPDVQAALAQIESRASGLADTTPQIAAAPADAPAVSGAAATASPSSTSTSDPSQIEDGRCLMHQLFVDGRVTSAGDFDQLWQVPDLAQKPKHVIEPFIQLLADRGVQPVEKSVRMLVEKARAGYVPLERYDVDVELARTFPKATCQRWCVLPFDRLGKVVLVATANPFNQQAARELEQATKNRLLWYLAAPQEITKILKKIFR